MYNPATLGSPVVLFLLVLVACSAGRCAAWLQRRLLGNRQVGLGLAPPEGGHAREDVARKLWGGICEMCCGYVTKPTLLQDLRACLKPAITRTQDKHALQGHLNFLEILQLLSMFLLWPLPLLLLLMLLLLLLQLLLLQVIRLEFAHPVTELSFRMTSYPFCDKHSKL